MKNTFLLKAGFIVAGKRVPVVIWWDFASRAEAMQKVEQREEGYLIKGAMFDWISIEDTQVKNTPNEYVRSPHQRI